MFDEESGKVITDRLGFHERRKGRTPCECSVGCAKGHWRDEPDLTVGEEAVVSMWRTPFSLSEAERRDDFLQVAFAALSEQQERLERFAREEMIVTLATIVRR